MYDVRRTPEFNDWLDGLRDDTAVAKVITRIARAEGGNLGDAKSVGNRVFELRIDYGPGYRLYFIREGQTIIVLLCGGDKSTQAKDIKRAIKIAADWRKS